MLSSIKMSCSKLSGWAAEEAELGEEWGDVGKQQIPLEHPQGRNCWPGQLGHETDLGRGTFELSVGDTDLFCHEILLWSAVSSPSSSGYFK